MAKTAQAVAWATGVLVVAGLGVAVLAPGTNSVKESASSAATSAAGAAIAASSGAAKSELSTAASAPSAAGSAAGTGGAAVGPSPTTPPAVPADTVVRSGSLDIEVGRGDFTSAFSTAAGVARSLGGFVVTAEMGPAAEPGPVTSVPSGLPDGVDSVGPATGGGSSASPPATVGSSAPAPTSGTLVLRIPGTQFDAARQRLEALGSLRAEQLSGQDAGGQLSDLAARIADLQAEQAGLRTMAAKAPSTDALLQIQTQLAAVQQQIDGLTAQQATLQNQVALASLTVSIEEPAAVAPQPRAHSILSTRLAQAGHGVEAMLGGILVVLAYGAPLAVLAGLAWLGWLGVRRRRVVGTIS